MKPSSRLKIATRGVFLGLVLVLQGTLQAQESNPPARITTPAVTIDALVGEALRSNPELRFYEAEIAAAKGGRKAAGNWQNPEITGSIGQKTVRGPDLSTEGVAWSVGVVQPFEWPGRVGLRKAIANRDVDLAELGYERFKMALAARIRVLAYTLFAAQEESSAAAEVAERFRALRETLVQRDPAGLTPLLETRIIEAGELTLQRGATEAALAEQTARLELNQLRGALPDDALLVARTEFQFRPPPATAALMALARTNNFDLRLRAVELAQQGFRVSLARNERFPTLSLGPNISEERASDRERIIGLGISIPLPVWNRNQGSIDIAQARLAQAETVLFVAQRETDRHVLEAALAYESKRRQMTQWRADSAEHFKQAAELADRHYRLGAVPVATYMELQDKYLEAVKSLLTTKRETLDAAQRLEQLTGLTPSLVAASTNPTQEPKP